jgi:hypothetical protein
VSTGARVALAVAALLSGWATAAEPCVSVPGTTELTVEQLGRVLFRELTTDRARDVVTFGGGVCLELGEVVVRVEAPVVTVRSLATDARVEAQRAVVVVAAWRLVAQRLVLAAGAARLEDVTLEGDGVVGYATRLDLDLEGGTMAGVDLQLRTPTVWLTADAGTFDASDRLRVVGVVASTCDCPPASAPLRIEGAAATVDIANGVIVLEAGELVAGEVRVDLPASWQVSEDSLASLTLPFAIAFDDAAERGVVLELRERRLAGRSDGGEGRVGADGAFGDGRVGADVAFGADAEPRFRTWLVVSSEGADARFEVRDDALAIGFARRLPVGPHLELVLAGRHEGGDAEDRLQDASVSLRGVRPLMLPPGRIPGLTIEVDVAATVGLSAQTRDSTDVLRARTATVGALVVSASGAPSLRLEVGATRYGTAGEGQAWFGASARWRILSGPVEADLHHAWRSVRGVSPFDERIDALDDVHRTDVGVALRGGRAGARFLGTVDLGVDWQRRVGGVALERLRLSALVAGASATPGVEWEISVVADAAGLLDPRADGDAWLRAGVRAVRAEGGELALSGEFGMGPAGAGVRSVVVAVATPFTSARGDVVLEPYLALDLWPRLSSSGAPRIVGHGLALRWTTCCGVLDVGYRLPPGGAFTTRISFAVPPRDLDVERVRP